MRINWTKIIITNFLITVMFLTLAEFSARALRTARDYLRGACDYSMLTNFKVGDIEEPHDIGLSRYDRDVGYTPKEGFDGVINVPGEWKNVRVTINNQGFRSNDNYEAISNNKPTLVIGDSYTFGDQVSNNETWPSCLERKTATKVDNAGVFGYGAAQAIKRASNIIKNSTDSPYSRVIFSIVVLADFSRERLSYRNGFARPAVIKRDGDLVWADIPDPNAPGTKYNKKAPNAAVVFLYKYSYIAHNLLTKVNFDPVGNKLTFEHPGAASKENIIYWTLDRFAELSIPEKIVVLQYHANLTGEVQQERTFLLNALAKYPFRYVDTYDVLTGKDPVKYWFQDSQEHHTPLGNILVCDAILDKIK